MGHYTLSWSRGGPQLLKILYKIVQSWGIFKIFRLYWKILCLKIYAELSFMGKLHEKVMEEVMKQDYGGIYGYIYTKYWEINAFTIVDCKFSQDFKQPVQNCKEFWAP